MPHLFLVDDDDLFRESLGLNLVDEGYEVTSFDNSRDALAYLNDSSADVLLLDWRMLNLTGVDGLRQMRSAGITIPVIFLPVLSDDIYEQAALEGGAVDFIDKTRRLPIALIQDAAYQSLLKRTRQQYHERAAKLLEDRFPEVTS